MFKLVRARSRGRGQTHSPRRGSSRVGATNSLRAEALSERGGGAGHGGLTAPATARGVARPLRSEKEQRGSRRAARAPGPAVSASPPPRFTFWGPGGGAPPDRRPRVCLLRLARWAGRRRGAQTGSPRRAPSSPAPRPRCRLAAAPGPRPAPPRLWVAPSSGPSRRRAHGSRGGRPAPARLPARSVDCPRSGVRRPARRSATPGGAALFPWRRRPRRPRSGLHASSARRRHLAVAAQLRALPGL